MQLKLIEKHLIINIYIINDFFLKNFTDRTIFLKIKFKKYNADNYNLNKKWNVFGGVNINYLSNQQYRSPMVRNRIDFSPSLGIVFKF